MFSGQQPLHRGWGGRRNTGPAEGQEVTCFQPSTRARLSRCCSFCLQRPTFCPIKHLSAAEAAASPLEVQRRGVDLGVALLLQTADHRVLLTRRAKQLRIFPNVWVPPGLTSQDAVRL